MSERPAIISIQEVPLDGHVRVIITLAWQDERYSGEAVGPTDRVLRPRLVGEATLRAVEEVADNQIHLSLAAIATTPLGNAQVAMAQVELEGGDEPFVGSAILREHDDAGATVKAVLDAINRRLGAVL